MQPNMRAINIDTQNLIADSFKTTDEEDANVDSNGNIESLSRGNNNLWDQEW